MALSDLESGPNLPDDPRWNSHAFTSSSSVRIVLVAFNAFFITLALVSVFFVLMCGCCESEEEKEKKRKKGKEKVQEYVPSVVDTDRSSYWEGSSEKSQLRAPTSPPVLLYGANLTVGKKIAREQPSAEPVEYIAKPQLKLVDDGSKRESATAQSRKTSQPPSDNAPKETVSPKFDIAAKKGCFPPSGQLVCPAKKRPIPPVSAQATGTASPREFKTAGTATRPSGDDRVKSPREAEPGDGRYIIIGRVASVDDKSTVCKKFEPHHKGKASDGIPAIKPMRKSPEKPKIVQTCPAKGRMEYVRRDAPHYRSLSGIEDVFEPNQFEKFKREQDLLAQNEEQ